MSVTVDIVLLLLYLMRLVSLLLLYWSIWHGCNNIDGFFPPTDVISFNYMCTYDSGEYGQCVLPLFIQNRSLVLLLQNGHLHAVAHKNEDVIFLEKEIEDMFSWNGKILINTTFIYIYIYKISCDRGILMRGVIVIGGLKFNKKNNFQPFPSSPTALRHPLPWPLAQIIFTLYIYIYIN